MSTLLEKYGNLTPLSEVTRNHVRFIKVRCACGATKDVRYHDLTRGRVKSCGVGACKSYNRAKEDPTYWPAPPRVCTVEELVSMWKQNTGALARRKSAVEIAKENDINVDTLGYLFRSIRRAGGITKYKRKVQQWLNATTKKSTSGTTPAPKPRKTARPATPPAGKPKPRAKSARATARKSTTSKR